MGTIVVDDELPFPQRGDLMSLDVVRQADTLRGPVHCPRDDLFSLKTRDIAGARPSRRVPGQKRPSHAVGCTHPEHPGGRARTRYPAIQRRPRDFSLTTCDLQGAQTRDPNLSLAGNRVVDPVQPCYRMMSSEAHPVTPLKYSGRHATDVSDIEKACPRPPPQPTHRQDPNDSTDICPPARRPMPPGQPQSARAAAWETDTPQATPRLNTDLFDPIYQWHAPEGVTSLPAVFTELEDELSANSQSAVKPVGDARANASADERYGPIPKSKPRVLHRGNGEPHLKLVCSDIDGATPQRRVGAQPFHIYAPVEVRPITAFHDPGDIEGAQHDTLRRGFNRSTRCTDPLDPQYQELGARRLQELPTLSSERMGYRRGSAQAWGHGGAPDPAQCGVASGRTPPRTPPVPSRAPLV